MEELFDFAKFDSYKEDNRREVKKQKADFQIACGILLITGKDAQGWKIRPEK